MIIVIIIIFKIKIKKFIIDIIIIIINLFISTIIIIIITIFVIIIIIIIFIIINFILAEMADLHSHPPSTSYAARTLPASLQPYVSLWMIKKESRKNDFTRPIMISKLV